LLSLFMISSFAMVVVYAGSPVDVRLWRLRAFLTP
jgi:hypothetical protein